MNTKVEIVPIDGNTWRIEDDYVRFFLLEGTERALLIDSGVNTPDAREIVGRLSGKPLLLLNTHGDGDHISGNGAFASYYIGEADFVNLGLRERFPESEPVFLKDGDILELGGRTLKILLIPGHTCGSAAVLDLSRRTLYAGDSVADSVIYMFGDRRSAPDYLQSLERLQAMKPEFDRIYASHGRPELPPDAVDRVREDFERALAGELPSENEVLDGVPVTTCRGDFCGFYLPRYSDCERKKQLL